MSPKIKGILRIFLPALAVGILLSLLFLALMNGPLAQPAANPGAAPTATPAAEATPYDPSVTPEPTQPPDSLFAGMTKDEMTHAFDQFWRADNSVVRETGGVGLGLSIARGLTRRMGGDLTVSSRAGGGCVFTLNLPVAKSTAEGDSNG